MLSRQSASAVDNTPDLVDPSLHQPATVADEDRRPVPVAVAVDETAAHDGGTARFDRVSTDMRRPGNAGPAEGVAPPIDWNQPFG